MNVKVQVYTCTCTTHPYTCTCTCITLCIDHTLHGPVLCNIHVHVHTCIMLTTDKHSKMLNMTARLAVEIRNLPDWDVDWNDTAPQRDLATVTISDLLPGEADGTELQKRAVHHIMHILVEEFPSLANLQAVLPSSHAHAVGRSNVVPMKILFKDEKYKSETTEILARLVKDAIYQENQRYTYMHMHINIS